MRCPYCGSFDDKVIESRTMANGESTRRRRECLSCGYRFTSYERIEEKPYMVIKRDKTREPFDTKKLFRGIERAFEKRPVSSTLVEQLTTEIEDACYTLGKSSREISTTDIGEVVLQRMINVDKIAYIRFASVYKHFDTLEEFISEVQKLGELKD